MDPAQLARVSAIGRVGFGVGLLSRPTMVTGPWIGREAARPGAQVLARALGARDLVLGLGTLVSGGRSRQLWLTAALAADGADLAATMVEPRLPRAGRAGVAVAAGTGLAMGVAALAGMRGRAKQSPPAPRRP